MLRDAFGNPFLFSYRLIRHNVIDVGIFLLGTLHPPTASLASATKAVASIRLQERIGSSWSVRSRISDYRCSWSVGLPIIENSLDANAFPLRTYRKKRIIRSMQLVEWRIRQCLHISAWSSRVTKTGQFQFGLPIPSYGRGNT